MATTPNYGFIMPDPTDFVTNLPADFEIFGDEVDARIKALNPETTQGDISFRGATANAKTRLGIGTAGQVLTVNSGATTPEWATPAGGPASFSLLNAGGTALTGTSVTVSGISGRNTLMIFVATASTNTASDRIIMRFNADTTAANYAQAGFTLESNLGSGINNYGSTNYIELGRMSNNAGSQVRGGVTITGCNSTGGKALTTAFGVTTAGGSDATQTVSQGLYLGTSTISSVTITNVLGNSFDLGTIYVYGSAN